MASRARMEGRCEYNLRTREEHFRFAGDGRLDDLYEQLVEGKAPTAAGELVRAITHLCARWNCHGERIGADTCSPAAVYITFSTDQTVAAAVGRLNREAPGLDEERYNKRLDDLYIAVLAYIEAHPELREIGARAHEYPRTQEIKK